MVSQVLGEKVAKELKDNLMQMYGLNIDDARFFYSSTNCAFIFENNPFMIRVSFRNVKERANIISELLWVDDLKQFIETVCEPKPSNNNKLMEELVIDDNVYRICMFRTAKGSVLPIDKLTPLMLICIGELIGKIHSVSENEMDNDFKFNRGLLDGYFEFGKQLAYPKISDELKEWIEEVDAKVRSLDRSSKNFGLCHCDLHLNNFFVDINNVWLFDFDSAQYADYMYDVSTFLIMCLIFGYGHGRDAHKVIHEELLPYLKIGYSLAREVDDSFWDKVDLFIIYRTMNMSMQLCAFDDIGVVNDIVALKQMFAYWLSGGEEKFFENVTNSFMQR